MQFLDTNYFLRFLVRDVEDQYQLVKELFKEGSVGKVNLGTSLVVVFEVYWVLNRFYDKQQEELQLLLKKLLALSFIYFQEGLLLQQAVYSMAEVNYDLEDAYNLVYAQDRKAIGFKSFDEKLLRKWKAIITK